MEKNMYGFYSRKQESIIASNGGYRPTIPVYTNERNKEVIVTEVSSVIVPYSNFDDFIFLGKINKLVKFIPAKNFVELDKTKKLDKLNLSLEDIEEMKKVFINRKN